MPWYNMTAARKALEEDLRKRAAGLPPQAHRDPIAFCAEMVTQAETALENHQLPEAGQRLMARSAIALVYKITPDAKTLTVITRWMEETTMAALGRTS